MERSIVTSIYSKSNVDISSVTLLEWISEHHSEDELHTLFLNMDRTLKYIHEHGYCIYIFYPTEINVLNGENDHIQFKKLVELSHDDNIAKEMIKEDIFKSALIQIGIYSNSLKYLKPDFVKENFDAFVQFIPQDEVPYYRGVIQRGASVYYCEFSLEKRKRDLMDLERQLGEGNNSNITPIHEVNEDEITNKKVNDLIYRQISGISEAAFLNVLIIPIIVLIIIMVFMIIALIINVIN